MTLLPGFEDPTKFIGPVYTESDAQRLQADKGWAIKKDGGNPARGGRHNSHQSTFEYRICMMGRTMSDRKFLVPIDGSSASLRALDFVIEQQLRSKNDSLVVLHVLNLGSADQAGVSAVAPTYLDEAAKQASAQALEPAVRKCEQMGVSFKATTGSGLQIAGAIVDAAREESVDQIVMGTRGLGRLQGVVLGSVATQVIHLSHVPITLVK